MYTVSYPERKEYVKYDTGHYMLYLNETEDQELPGYSYTGEQEDGGTLIEAKNATYEAFVSGLIRKRYSADAVEAIQANRMVVMKNSKHPRAKEFNAEWKEYQDYREECKKQIQNLNL